MFFCCSIVEVDCIPPIPFISTNITIHIIGENGIDVDSKIIQRLDVVSIGTRERDFYPPPPNNNNNVYELSKANCLTK